MKDTRQNVIDKVYNDMLHKLCNTRTKEFFRGKFEKDLATSGKVVEADQSLRDNLKTFSIAKNRWIYLLVCTCNNQNYLSHRQPGGGGRGGYFHAVPNFPQQ